MEHNPLMDKIEVEYSDYTHDQHMELYQDIVKCIKIKKYVSD